MIISPASNRILMPQRNLLQQKSLPSQHPRQVVFGSDQNSLWDWQTKLEFNKMLGEAMYILESPNEVKQRLLTPLNTYLDSILKCSPDFPDFRAKDLAEYLAPAVKSITNMHAPSRDELITYMALSKLSGNYNHLPLLAALSVDYAGPACKKLLLKQPSPQQAKKLIEWYGFHNIGMALNNFKTSYMEDGMKNTRKFIAEILKSSK